MSTVTLYHFTSPDHLPLILADGFLKTVESNVSFRREHAGPDVVWLTTHERAEAGHGLENPRHDKRAIRFTVRLDKRAVHRWREWARAKGSSAETMALLAEASGGGVSSWRVTERAIPSSAWVEVRDMRTGEVLWSGDPRR